MSNMGVFSSVGPIQMESVSNVTATNSVQLGTRITYQGEDYVYCYNAGNSSAPAGFGMIISGLSGNSVTVSSTAETDIPHCFVKHATAATATYFWGLVRGVVQAQVNSTMATGVPIILGTNGQVQSYATGTQSFPAVIIGRTLSSATATSFALCYVKCFG